MKHKDNKSVTLLNMFASLFLQAITIISNFVIRKITLDYFGSDVNGLISSLTQFLNYITLFEGGLVPVLLASLYAPLAKNDSKKVSKILHAANRFYDRLSVIFVIYAIALGIIYPIVINTPFSFGYIFSLTLIIALYILAQNIFKISWRILLSADKKVYVVAFTQSLMLIVSTVLFFIGAKVFPDIHLLKFISGVVFIAQPFIYKKVAKKYVGLAEIEKGDNYKIKNRWDGLGISIATFIHKNTDIVVLTCFSGLINVSIYSVYAMIVEGIKTIITSVSAGIIPTIGHLHAKENREELNKVFSLYEYIVFCLTTLLFTLGGLLLVPFVAYYTTGVQDANYNEPIFGIILLMSEVIFCLKEPFVNLAYASGEFKKIKVHAYIEAIINIVLSIVFVQKLGLIGIALGTLAAMTYRTAFHIIFLRKEILFRPIKIFMKKLVNFSLVSLLGIAICHFCFPISGHTLGELIYTGILYFVILATLIIIDSTIFYRKECKYLKDYLKKSFLVKSN